ncbi:hypothetical protein A2U01_0072305 [Trifolium medium]|uniref:Uncharacterized protein n=1 Tax=Trifolium medium TaxID=97028 RepID=A0A392SQC0_9FABA|nr:hypothetical protein [Trifolium medium]
MVVVVQGAAFALCTIVSLNFGRLGVGGLEANPLWGWFRARLSSSFTVISAYWIDLGIDYQKGIS